MGQRRVVTGHDANGRAVVIIDDQVDGVVVPGVTDQVIWTTRGFPVDNTGDRDLAGDANGLTVPNGTVFRVVVFEAGTPARVHRTDSVDYGIVLSGEIEMQLDEGVSVHLKAGDVVVQRGTIHNWTNTGTEPCAVAFILVDARPVAINGRVLHAEG